MTGVLDMAGADSGALVGVMDLDKQIGYNPILSLERDGELNIRTRLYVLTSTQTDEELTLLRARLDNSWPNFGSDMLKYVGVGEGVVTRTFFAENPRGTFEAMRLIAERGFPYHQHLMGSEQIDAYLDIWEEINKEFNLAELRWTPGHLTGMTKAQIDRFNALGLGLALHGIPYLDPLGARQGGTPWRTALESGAVALGGGADGARIAPMNPWPIIYYMVTGKNYAGVLENEGETISRYDAIRLYASTDQGWFTKEDDTLGGIGVGRYGDIVVLNKNFFDPDAVPEEEIRQMRAALTIVGGKIVYSDGTLRIQPTEFLGEL
jgi:predicted amidohydrolase YtcJ